MEERIDSILLANFNDGNWEEARKQLLKLFSMVSKSIRIWDIHNKQWLEPMAIYFGEDNTIWKVDACKPNEHPLKDGWYNFKGNDLKQIAIVGTFEYNTYLLPNVC